MSQETKVVVIYGKTNCPWCDRAKVLAEDKGLDVEYINIVEAGIDGAKLSEICGVPVRTVPQIFIGEQYILGGYDGLNKEIGSLPSVKKEEAE